jgi:hypothetical protein
MEFSDLGNSFAARLLYAIQAGPGIKKRRLENDRCAAKLTTPRSLCTSATRRLRTFLDGKVLGVRWCEHSQSALRLGLFRVAHRQPEARLALPALYIAERDVAASAISAIIGAREITAAALERATACR